MHTLTPALVYRRSLIQMKRRFDEISVNSSAADSTAAPAPTPVPMSDVSDGAVGGGTHGTDRKVSTESTPTAAASSAAASSAVAPSSRAASLAGGGAGSGVLGAPFPSVSAAPERLRFSLCVGCGIPLTCAAAGAAPCPVPYFAAV
jgi:hypothetical protein